MQEVDWRLFQLVNGVAGHSSILDSLLKLCAQGLEYLLILLALSLWLTPGENRQITGSRQRLVVYAVLAALLALGINQLIGLAWFRPRPFATHHVALLIAHSADSSFPSDHAAGGFALATAVFLAADRWARRLGWAMLALAALLAFARVYIGAHYPFDVIAGGLIGASVAVVLQLASRLTDPFLCWLLLPFARLTAGVTERLGIDRWHVPAQ